MQMARLRDKLEEVPSRPKIVGLRGLEAADRAAYVERKRAERERIQRAIHEVSAEREAYLRAAPARGGPGTGIDDALLEAIRAQAVAAGLLPDCQVASNRRIRGSEDRREYLSRAPSIAGVDDPT